MTVMPMPRVPELTDVELDVLRTLVDQWQAKLLRNRLRARYYDHRSILHHLGISIPPQMRNLEAVIGWPSKAVNSLADRVNFDGFVLPGTSEDPYGLQEILAANHFDVEVPMAQTSALIHACAFIAVTRGDLAAGEPDVLMIPRDAMSSTGMWDSRRRGLTAALSVIDVDEGGDPVHLVMYLGGFVVTIEKTPAGRWLVDRRFHDVDRPLVEPLVYRPRLGRPFGSSRISRAVMSITDTAARTALRQEVSAEFYSTPQRWAMGAQENDFVDANGNPKTGWETLIGRVWAMGRDEDGNVPQVGQFAQMSMQPHDDMMRGLATRFAGETQLPVSSLGIVQDNPASAEAIYAAKEELVIEAERTGVGFGTTLRRCALTAIQLRDGLTTITPEMARLRAKYRDPATPSKSAASAAVVDQVREGILPPDSEVTYEQLGYDQTTIARLLADKRRNRTAGRSGVLTQQADEAVRANPLVAELAGTDGEPS